jgi:phenylalanyl-tRNA synthetase beta chain
MPMTINTAWLLEYIDGGCTHEQLIDALPKVGLEVEELHDLQAELEPIVKIGFIREKKPLTDGLFALQVELSKGTLTPIVCASEHPVEVGWGVPVAISGSDLPTGTKIRPGNVHGARSEGMICLDGEMGLVAQGTGMFHTTDESLLGKSLVSVRPTQEKLAVLNVLPNRPDFLGMIGIAREVAALLKLKLKHPKVASLSLESTGPVSVQIDEPRLCTRYIGGLVRGVKVAPSPAWLKSKLLICGIKPRNNVVDITNYVLFEYGQPLHAFDADTFKGGTKVVVRRMRDGEQLKLLGKESKVVDAAKANRPLVICDSERPVALAGIMGGAETETASATTNVLLEAAHFDAVNIRKTVRSVDLGLAKGSTDSSYRFERGTDPNAICELAFKRAIELLATVAGGAFTGPATDNHVTPTPSPAFKLSSERTSRYLGVNVSAETIFDSLTRLEMTVTPSLEVTVPTWRADANDPVVLIEDVARMIGYDSVPATPSSAPPTLGTRSAIDQLRRKLAEQLVAGGFFETRNATLESGNAASWLLDDAATSPTVVELSNFATKEMQSVRRTLLNGLSRVVDTNIRRGVEAVRFYEIDRAFDATAKVDDATKLGRWSLGVVAGGSGGTWRNKQPIDFHDLRGTLDALLVRARVEGAAYKPIDAAPFVKGTATRVVAASGASLGWIGEVDAAAAGIDRMTFKLYAFELDLEAVLAAQSPAPQYKPLARMPAVTRDLAFVLKVDQPYAAIESAMRQSAGASLESLALMDRYEGKQVASGHHSLAFRLVFRDASRTLTTDEVTATTDAIVTAMKSQFGAELRA